MIVFFGPAGAGKSMQGHLLAARHGWRWMSTGQMLRESKDEALLKMMHAGKLVPDAVVDEIVIDALRTVGTTTDIVLDGYPRNLKQAEYLVATRSKHGQKIELAIVINVTRSEIAKRLAIRGRADDTVQAIDKRLAIFTEETGPILEYLTAQDIPVIRIDGNRAVGRIHDDIEQALANRGVVEEA